MRYDYITESGKTVSFDTRERYNGKPLKLKPRVRRTKRQNFDLWFLAMCGLVLTALAFLLVARHQAKPVSFDARWAPVSSMAKPVSYKGDRLNLIHDVATGPECHWASCRLT